MNPMRWLENIALTITGTKRCNTPDKLLAYMQDKDLAALHHWVEARMWYTPDGGKPWRQNWTPLNEVLARDVPGSDIESDCEERSVAKKFVINKLKWGVAENLVVWADNDKTRDGGRWCHCACAAWMFNNPPLVTLLDYRITTHVSVEEAIQEMGRQNRVRPTRWCFCDNSGVLVSEVFKI